VIYNNIRFYTSSDFTRYLYSIGKNNVEIAELLREHFGCHNIEISYHLENYVKEETNET